MADTALPLMGLQLIVDFEAIPDWYTSRSDITCNFCFTRGKTGKNGDKIALFLVGWKRLSEQLISEPFNGKTYITFDKRRLPDNPQELYQFIYISEDRIVQGVSTPFYISQEHPKNSQEIERLRQVLEEKDRVISSLENDKVVLSQAVKLLSVNREKEMAGIEEQMRAMWRKIEQHENDLKHIKDCSNLGRVVEFEDLKLPPFPLSIDNNNK